MPEKNQPKIKKREELSSQLPSYLEQGATESVMRQYNELIAEYNNALSKLTAKAIAVNIILHFIGF